MCIRERIVAWVCRASTELRACLLPVVVLASSVLAILALAASPALAAERCTNEAVRAEQGAAALSLPECRAYEMVTPPDEHPNLENNATPVVGAGPGLVEAVASTSGGSVAFRSWYAPSGSSSNGQIFGSIRGEGGWATSALEPQHSPEKENCPSEKMYFSAELTGQVLVDNPEVCSGFEPALAPYEARGGVNLFVHPGAGAAYELLNRVPEGVTPTERVYFEGASSDMSHVVFSQQAQLTAEAPPGEDLYEWNNGVLRLVTFLPNGTPIQGTMATPQREAGGFANSPAAIAHSLSSDGERVVFEAGGSLYLRENSGQAPSAIVPGSTQVDGEQCSEPDKACTIQLDASHGSGSSGGGFFWRASIDGSRIYFTDESRLVPESTAVSGKPDLYEFDVETGQLTDLTVDPTEAADVQGVMGSSEDGTYLYFVAYGVLSEQPNGRGSTAERREPNLYVHHEGVTSYIATLSPKDGADWGWGAERNITFIPSEVSPNGKWLAFNSMAPLTGYENMPAEPSDCLGAQRYEAPGEPCNEIFVYDAASNGLSCASCGPVGGNPTGQAQLRSPQGTLPRGALSTDGSVFFDTPSSLLGQDTNGVYDVYEWSPVGVGECTEGSGTFGAESDGCLYSLSTGTSPESSFFVGASESGSDAYMLTSQGLVAGDTDNALSLYDVRVNGGFPAGSGEAAQEPACQSEEACQPPPGEAPAQLFAASSVLAGAANLTAPPVPITPSSNGGGTSKRGLTRLQKLARALRICRKRPPRKHARCEAMAHRRYGRKSNGKQGGKGGGR